MLRSLQCWDMLSFSSLEIAFSWVFLNVCEGRFGLPHLVCCLLTALTLFFIPTVFWVVSQIHLADPFLKCLWFVLQPMSKLLNFMTFKCSINTSPLFLFFFIFHFFYFLVPGSELKTSLLPSRRLCLWAKPMSLVSLLNLHDLLITMSYSFTRIPVAFLLVLNTFFTLSI